MMELSEKFLEFARAAWTGRGAVWARLPCWREKLESLEGEARVLFQYLAGTLPLTDLGDYAPELVLDSVREGLLVREEFPWCTALSEELFCKDVLYPRVNTEKLDPCRGMFRRELALRLEGLSLPEAILEVNRWCGENVVYRSTDDTTSSALDIYRRGWGRCGEESVFAVNALRSVGIAARQVYAPRWSHCDDNHAWVEAWDGAHWRFLGACEPEPRLDMGWFIPAAGRAMLCHTKVFVGEAPGWEFLFPGVSPLDLNRREGVAYESVTARYAKARPFEVRVAGPQGEPLCRAEIGIYLLNDGGLREIARRIAGENGEARLNLGLGSLWVTAEKDGLFGEALVHTGETEKALLTLSGSRVEPGSFDFLAPADSGRTSPALTEEEKQSRRREMERLKEARRARKRAEPPSERRPLAGWALGTLTRKDRAGSLPEALWRDCEGALAHESGLSREVFESALLCPRIGLEPLAPWRELLEGAALPDSPEELWGLAQALPTIQSFPELPQTPAGAWKLGAVQEAGRGTLFCALCRAKGIPARIAPGGWPEFWREGAFRRAGGEASAWLTVKTPPGERGALGLMAWDQGWRMAPLRPGEAVELPAGEYRLIASTRLPGGNQLGEMQEINLKAGESRTVEARFRKASREELLQRLKLPPLGISWEGPSLLCWVDPGAEPTEHLLNELQESAEKLGALCCGVHLIGGEALGERLPGAKLWPENREAAEAAARRMYLEPGRLPLLVLADGEGYGRFACAGYNVGSVDLAAHLTQVILSE
ncbi:transglutaminase domain-containing protein [Acutalibacter sp. 1XD8-33]|uniref:transglutaminase domain-containing protein n=1 Tax=Acutalibacter sp. 1XD8-33 TaxID=2320081 RepID=UPI000EA09C68|nr:transglutaminase domain-containing protein [Acutalibacter sp. 1XD8-33]RKJ41360.1 transglutaminase domain-containing protein [Acutalibacter sp. 1XD8-33]